MPEQLTPPPQPTLTERLSQMRAETTDLSRSEAADRLVSITRQRLEDLMLHETAGQTFIAPPDLPLEDVFAKACEHSPEAHGQLTLIMAEHLLLVYPPMSLSFLRTAAGRNNSPDYSGFVSSVPSAHWLEEAWGFLAGQENVDWQSLSLFASFVNEDRLLASHPAPPPDLLLPHDVHELTQNGGSSYANRWALRGLYTNIFAYSTQIPADKLLHASQHLATHILPAFNLNPDNPDDVLAYSAVAAGYAISADKLIEEGRPEDAYKVLLEAVSCITSQADDFKHRQTDIRLALEALIPASSRRATITDHLLPIADRLHQVRPIDRLRIHLREALRDLEGKERSPSSTGIHQES